MMSDWSILPDELWTDIIFGFCNDGTCQNVFISSKSYRRLMFEHLKIAPRVIRNKPIPNLYDYFMFQMYDDPSDMVSDTYTTGFNDGWHNTVEVTAYKLKGVSPEAADKLKLDFDNYWLRLYKIVLINGNEKDLVTSEGKELLRLLKGYDTYQSVIFSRLDPNQNFTEKKMLSSELTCMTEIIELNMGGGYQMSPPDNEYVINLSNGKRILLLVYEE